MNIRWDSTAWACALRNMHPLIWMWTSAATGSGIPSILKRGKISAGWKNSPTAKRYRTRIRWKPDLEVFTDIQIPAEYYLDTIRRQAIVNAGLTFLFRDEQEDGSFAETAFCYENGIVDHVKEAVGEDALTPVQFWQTERMVRDREDKPEYRTKINVACAFSNRVKFTEYYHNSSWLEYGGAPDKAVRNAFVYQIDAYLKQNNKYTKNESRIAFTDVEDCLAAGDFVVFEPDLL